MLNIQRLGKILEPTINSFESQAVLNPAVYQDGNSVHLIYRAIGADGISSLGYARLNGPTELAERWDRPYLAPKLKIESKGIEDPRIVKIDGTFYLTYVVHNGKNAVSAFSSGQDILNLKRGFVLSPNIPYKDADEIFRFTKLKDQYYFFQAFYQDFSEKNILIWHKDFIPFPEKINDKFYFLERILPDVQVVSCENLEELKNKYFWVYHLMHLSEAVLLESIHGFEARHVGGGCPPIKTEDGWLILYHGAYETNKTRVYSAGAALADLNDPRKLIARLPHPLLAPGEDYELFGTVNNVVFPTGSAIFGEDLYIYYGAADKFIAAAKVNLKELLAELKNNPV